MRSRRVHVCGRDAGRADVVAVLDETEHVLDAVDLLLLETDDLNLLLGVLQYTQLLLVVQQVKHLQHQPQQCYAWLAVWHSGQHCSELPYVRPS